MTVGNYVKPKDKKKIKVGGQKKPYKEHPAVKNYQLVTKGYIEHFDKQAAIANAKDLAKAYQTAVRKFQKLDPEKVRLWKAIRKRLEQAYANRAKTGSIRAFTPSWVAEKMGVDPPKEYEAEVESLSDKYEYDPTRWWHDCGVDVDKLKAKIRNKLYEDFAKDDTEKSADKLAGSIALDAWKNPKSEFVTFGRKALVLETAIELFGEELQDYVLYGGGDIHGVDGGKRDYEWVRNNLGYDLFQKNVAIDRRKGLLKSPPPSPFLVELSLVADYNSQLNVLRHLTGELDKSHVGREFLRRITTEIAPWHAHPEVEPSTEFYIVGGDGYAHFVDTSAMSGVTGIEGLVGQHMGFNLLSFLDNPDRRYSRAAKPGTHTQKNWAQFQWLTWHWGDNKFITPSDGKGTVFRWNNRKDPPGENPCDPNTWTVNDNAKGKAMVQIATRAVRGGAMLLGTNCTVKGDKKPSSTFERTVVDDPKVRANVGLATGLAIGLGEDALVTKWGLSGSTSVVDWLEDRAELKGDLNTAEQELLKAKSGMMTGSAVLFLAAYTVVKFLQATRDGEELPWRDYFQIASVANAMVDMGNDMADNFIKKVAKKGGLEIAEQTIDLFLESVGLVMDIVDAVYTTRDAWDAIETGNVTRGAVMMGAAGSGVAGGVIGALATLSHTTFLAGTGQPYLYIVSAVLGGISLALVILTVTIWEPWSELEKWVLHSSFGKNHGQQTGQSERYYGFDGNPDRQLSYFQGVQLPGEIATCYVGEGSEESETEQFQFVMEGIKGLDGDSELLICALPKKSALPEHAQELYPLIRFKLGWSKQDLEERSEPMPNGMQFGQPDTLTVDEYSFQDKGGDQGWTFTVKTTLGNQANAIDVFRDYFLSPPAQSAYNENGWAPGWAINDWGWEVLSLQSPTPTYKKHLKTLDKSGKDKAKKKVREELFTMTVPRLRVQMAEQIVGTWSFDNQWLTSNR